MEKTLGEDLLEGTKQTANVREIKHTALEVIHMMERTRTGVRRINGPAGLATEKKSEFDVKGRTMTRPMLAAKLDNLSKISYPVFCTAKIDGIRCLMVNGQAVSRRLKPIRNKHVQKLMSTLPDGLDGELILRNSMKFNEISSAIMRESGEPDFLYCVFDVIERDPYLTRMMTLTDLDLPEFVQKIIPLKIEDEEALLSYEETCLANGFEGVMLRNGSGPYKHGRSTVREGWLMKWKRFLDAEAEVIGFAERMHNANPKTRDNLGHAKRSSHKENLSPTGTLGKLIVRRDDGLEFGVGTGFDDATRQEIWDNQGEYLGKLVKYRFQPHGVKEAPRFPTFLGFRDRSDTG